MCIKDELHRIVMESPGGIQALAARMRVPYSTLKSKLNPNCDTHHTYIEDLERIAELLDTDDIARYFAAQRDGVFVKSMKVGAVSDMALLDLFLEREQRYGKFASIVKDALADGNIDRKEFEKIRKAFDLVSESREQMMARLTEIHEQSVEREERLSLKAIK